MPGVVVTPIVREFARMAPQLDIEVVHTSITDQVDFLIDGRVDVCYVRLPLLNGSPAGRVELAGRSAAVSLVVENGRITRIHAVANPEKLTRLDEPAELAR